MPRRKPQLAEQLNFETGTPISGTIKLSEGALSFGFASSWVDQVLQSF